MITISNGYIRRGMDELKAKKILENRAVFAFKTSLPGDNTMVTILAFQGHFSQKSELTFLRAHLVGALNL